MKLNRLYLEYINSFDAETQEWLLKEAPHTVFQEVSTEFKFLDGVVDLNFENYDLPQPQRIAIYRAFCGEGVAVPGTKYKLRNTRLGSVVEQANGTELVLPSNWKRKVIVANKGGLVWLGKEVRPDQREGLDLSKMIETEDGWEKP